LQHAKRSPRDVGDVKATDRYGTSRCSPLMFNLSIFGTKPATSTSRQLSFHLLLSLLVSLLFALCFEWRASCIRPRKAVEFLL
jgi:hypothetical protein